jgi:hypothetical protein
MTKEEAIEVYNGLINQKIKAAFEFFAPELRESEDERITRAINNMLPFIPDESYANNGVTKEGVLNWLEKQKYEYEVFEPIENTLEYKAGFKAGIESEKKKEQKPPITGNDFGWIDELEHDLKHPEELDQKVDDVLKQRKGIMALEWSKEEKRKLNRIYAILGQAADTHAFSTTCRLIGDKEAVELQDFLRSIAKPQVAEWSEEDDKMWEHIIFDLREFRDCETDEELVSDYEDEISWLKSLRSRPKSSDNWKPSEEQMEALMRTITWLVEEGNHETSSTLADLRRELQKLM